VRGARKGSLQRALEVPIPAELRAELTGEASRNASEVVVAKSRSGTRGRRGPRKPVRRDVGIQGGTVLAADPRDRGAIELPSSITVKDLADLLGVNPPT